MKIFYTFSLFILSLNNIITAQSFLYGLANLGGDENAGCLFAVPTGSSNIITQRDFQLENPGVNAIYVKLTQAANGKLYGMTNNGGSEFLGILFEYDPLINKYTKKVNFIGTSNGSSPYGSLTLGNNGKLYGMTQGGGTNSSGVLFEYDPITDIYTKKLDFNGALLGRSPLGSMVKANNGILYGMTSGGGANNMGVLFEYDVTTDTYTKKLDFNGTLNGSFPSGSLLFAGNGKLYGMTRQGGTNNMGVLFEYDPVTNTYLKKLDFNGSQNGIAPYGDLMQAGNGKLYGMTSSGGLNSSGVLFEYDPVTNIYTKKMDFNGSANGETPYGSLTEAGNGKLYGMTYGGGTHNLGVLFEYDLNANNYSKKLDFNGSSNGGAPYGSLMLSASGKLYGMTSEGGFNESGVLFEYDPLSDTYTKKIELNGALNGQTPLGSLVKAANGKLYGMTFSGGAYRYGMLFEYDPVTHAYTKKLDFDGLLTGRNPFGSLATSNNKLYGLTQMGGINNRGVLFEYDPVTNTYTKKLDFDGAQNGAEPYGTPMIDGNGKLYGMTQGGGAQGRGVLFEFDLVTNTYVKKLDFNGSNGSNPSGSLVQANNGKLYGMTQSGGAQGLGVLFEFDPVTNTYIKRLDFNGTLNGAVPRGTLMQYSNGKLYGVTSGGGANSMGVLFEYNPATNTYTKKFDFNGLLNGAGSASPMQASNGKVYITTSAGGVNSYGVLLEYDPNTNTYTKKLDFNGSNGKHAFGQLVEVIVCTMTAGVTHSDVLCNGGATGSASVVLSGGTAPYTYQWPSLGVNTHTVYGLSASAYSVMATDVYSCSAKAEFTVTQPPVLHTTTTVIHAICNGRDGSAEVITSGGTWPYTYLWTSGSTSSVSSSPSGTHAVTVTDANSCIITNTVVINQPAALTLSASGNGSLCSGQTATLAAVGGGGTGTIIYSWTAGPSSPNYIVTPSSQTIYTVNIRDASNCAMSATLDVYVSITPTISASNATICSGSSVVITPTGAGPGGIYSISGGVFTVSPASTSIYSITGVNIEGCASHNTETVSILVNANPTISVNSLSVCSGSSLQIVPSGASNYTISGNTFIVTPTVTSNYAIVGSDVNGCISTPEICTVTVHPIPTVTANNPEICTGQTVIIIPSGANTYTITGNNFTVNPLTTSSYSVSGSNANGCKSHEFVCNVTVYQLPTLSLSASASLICIQETFSLIASGAKTYSWNTQQSGEQIVITPTVAETKIYIVTGTDTNNCTSKSEISVEIENCTSIEIEKAHILKLKLYPQPNNGLFIIESDKNALIQIVNSVGQVVHEQFIVSGNNNINIIHLPDGMYLVNVSGNYKAFTKLIKN